MMFVDESGDPGFPKSGAWSGWGGSRLFTRVGVIIHGWKWKGWNQKLEQFKKNRGLGVHDEIKGNHVRQGKGVFSGKAKDERTQFREDLARLIGSDAQITLIGVSIDKTKVDVSQKDRLAKPEVRSFELLLERYNRFLDEQKDKAGIVVLDPTVEPNDDGFRRFQSYLLTFSRNLRPSHIVEGTFFAKSHTSNMIQVADFCCHEFYRHEGRGVEGNVWKALKPRFWRRNGRLKGNGIKNWP